MTVTLERGTLTMPYAIKCITEGEQRLAQDILFKKGAAWGAGRRTPITRANGQYLIIRGKRITYLHLDQYEDRPDEYQLITMSELLHV